MGEGLSPYLVNLILCGPCNIDRMLLDCVCMYVYMYLCMYVCIDVCMYECVCVCVYICVCVCVCVHRHFLIPKCNLKKYSVAHLNQVQEIHCV